VLGILAIELKYGGVSFSSYGHFFVMKLSSPLTRSANHLLLKDDVGKSKPTIRELPGFDFTYGKFIAKDPEGLGAVISAWREHKSSPRGDPPRDFKKLNAMSVQEGYFTAKQASLFRSTSDFKVQQDSVGKLNKASLAPNSDIIFGVPGKPSTPMDAVIGNLYGRTAADIKAEEYAQPIELKKIGRPRLTKAHSYLANAVRTSLEPTPRQEFKMKKFKTVAPRTNTYSLSSSSSKAAET
jgi:hypothetical protein